MKQDPNDDAFAVSVASELTLRRLLRIAVERPRLALGGPIILSITVGIYFLVFGSYTARSTFTPQQQQVGLASLSGLASQFGLTGMSSSPLGGQSVAFYEELLQSPKLLSDLANTRYALAVIGSSDSLKGDLYFFYGVKGRTQDKRTTNMVERLLTRVSVETNVRANTVSVSVKAPFPELAKQVNRRLLELVSEFNVKTLQTNASEERRFTEQRLAEAREELAIAENAMQVFLERNRAYQSSPALIFESARLQRRLDLQQQLYVTLSQAYQQARITEVRNTPVITVIDPPELTATKSRNPLVMALAAFVLGAVAAIALALALDILNASAFMFVVREQGFASAVRGLPELIVRS